MGISDFYASTVVKVRVDFCFSGFSCSPDVISTSLGVEPDWKHEAGETWLDPAGKTRTHRQSGWGIRSQTPSKDVNEHFRELFGRLRSGGRDVATDRGERSFHVLWKGNYLYAGSGPFYEADVVAKAAELGASIWQDIYQVDQADEEIDTESAVRRIPKSFFTGDA